MWTNIFRIEGLHQISWFQFVPNESHLTPLPDLRTRAGQRDTATLQVLSSHLQLQKDGFLSAWTNSFVGPWDPSQGTHNPDEKIKLWLFLAGRHLSVSERAQPAVSGLRVIASGIWVCPGDSEEAATALSQALRNRLERSLLGLSYVRYGDVFFRHRSYCHGEELFRKGQPTIEFVFAASEDAIYVHALLSAKHVRTLSGGDMEKMLKLSSNNTSPRLPVIVSPHGMRGSVTGCCSDELVKHISVGSGTSMTELVGLPNSVAQTQGYKLQGHNCYVEVSLGCAMSNLNLEKSNHPTPNTPSTSRGDEKGSGDAPSCEKTFVYPSEAVLVPVLRPSYPRSSLKRFWLQNWAGMSMASSALFMYCDSKTDDVDDSWSESDGIHLRRDFNSSSNSNTSSMSSICSSSSDSDCITKASFGDLEADADSLTGRQSGLSSFTSMETNGPKQGLKRPRTGLDRSLIQAGGSLSAPTHDCDNSDITAVANDQTGSHWDWDDDDPGVGVDIQALLSEFGDFGDFFESDSLPFGEPPGTAESQTSLTHTFSGQEFGDRGASPAATAMDVSNQNHLPVGFQTVEPFHPTTRVEECVNAVQEATKSTTQFGVVSYAPAVSTGESDRLMKAEALLSFAPEYGAVDTSSSELSSSIFKSPYQPTFQKAESLNSCGNTYVYGATPPSSPGTNGPDENRGMAIDSRLEFVKSDTGAVLQKYYTQIAKVKNPVDRKCVMYDNTATSSERTSMSLLSSINSTTRTNSCQNIGCEIANGPEHLSLSRRILPASEMECLMFQASLCRVRHTLVSIGNPVPTTWNRSVSDSDSMLDSLSTKYELRKKEPILVRIAGDVDGRIPDGSSNAPIGVWRPVGAPRYRKSANIPTIEASSSLPHHTFSEETIAYGKRQQLKDFVNAIPLLVQQAASFVDLALDGEFVDGPYGWLTMEEQRRRGFCCGPHMAHAGCGGILASCHSIDIAGVDLVDPISADVQASSVMGLLQSDVKAALKSAFSTLDGPLSVIDWCKGRGQSVDAGTFLEALSAESSLSEYRDSSNIAMTSVENQLSPPHASVSISSVMRGKGDDTGQRKLNYEHGISESEQQLGSRRQATLSVIPYPSILVGYQDDWLKTSASSLQHWEKAPLEPYAFQKHMSYYVVCPNIDSLTSAAADFFQQLGTVYEACKLGNHTSHTVGNKMDVDAGKSSTSGFLLVDSPRSTKVESNTVSLMGSMSEYFLSLSNGWDLTSFLKSLSTVLKTLPLGSCLVENAKEANSSPCTVIYVVCPFPDPSAVLQTIIESSIALTSVVCSSDNDKRSMMCSQVGKALSYGADVDEASISNIPAISGFSIPKLVLQIVPIDAIFRVTSPSINEIVVLKEMAFTVYNKARRLSRGSFGGSVQSSSFSGRSHSSSMQTGNPVPGMWKDCVGSRISGPSLPRENDLDPGLRAGTWENTWQNARAVGLGCDSNRTGDVFQEQSHYLFEPLLILAEPGSVEQGVAPTFTGNLATELTKQMSDDTSAGLTQSLCGDAAPSSQLDGSEADGFGSGQQRQPPSLHCCYGWTEDWRWLVCVWTDSRGELLDNHIFPFGGISSRQDTKGMQNVFVQVIQQGCQLLQTCSPDNGVARARDFVITRIGCFYELECQEWQNALYFIGGSELKKWPLQLRRAGPDCVSSNSNGASLQQQELDRSLPSSPSPLYSPHSKTSSIMKGGVGQINSRKQVIGGPPVVDGSMGPLEWVQSISFVSVSMDHSLRLVSQADVSTGSLNYLEGFTPVKSLGHASASYILIPSRMRFLTPAPLQLPTCLTSESPPLAHLLHSKGYAIPLSTGFAVSKAVPSLKKDGASNIKEDWPSVLSVSLVDYFGGYSDKRGIHKQGGRDLIADARRQEIHTILESVVAELHALSWMTVSPAYLDRRTALPFHCDTVLRVRRLLHFADKETSHQPDMAKESQSHWAPVNHGVQM